MEELSEEVRWTREDYRYTSAEEFDKAWGGRRLWLEPNTRNHVVTPEGMSREERQDGPLVSIDDANVDTLRQLVEGRTIVKFTMAPSTGESWPEGANGVVIELDDGSFIEFEGWGYDAWGLDTKYRMAQ